MIRKAIVVTFVFLLLTLVVVVIVSASSGAEKPYLEGEGAEMVGKSTASPSNKPSDEGMAGVTGSSVNMTDASRGDIVEGEAGSTGRHLGTGISAETEINADLSLLYRFTGVSDDGQQGSATRREATSIHCTNVYTSTTEIYVKIYQWNGTDVFTGTVTMPANRTFTFSTQNTTIYFDDVILGGVPGTNAIFQGYGVILTDNPNVICTAQVLDPLNYPPEFVVQLELFR